MKALVIFSGGQDSTTCLGWAKNRFEEVEAITFVYGQNHAVEIVCAEIICQKLNIKQKLVDLSFLPSLVVSALTSSGDVNVSHPCKPSLPASFVPDRNALFFTLAHAYAQKVKAGVLIAGVCQTDYSGYPDCRQEFVHAIEYALKLGSEVDIRIMTPLMNLTKAEIFRLAKEEGVLDLVIEDSHTCYNGKRVRHEWGWGCGECLACKLRAKGWKER